MKTIEAIISLMVLLSFASLTLIQPPQQSTELAKYQLAEDVWRIAYLKGCFKQNITFPPAIDNSEFINTFEGKKELPDSGVLLLQETVESMALADPTNDMEECLNPLLEETYLETGFLIEFSSPIEAAGGPSPPKEHAVILHKVLILNGVPQEVTLAVE